MPDLCVGTEKPDHGVGVISVVTGSKETTPVIHLSSWIVPIDGLPVRPADGARDGVEKPRRFPAVGADLVSPGMLRKHDFPAPRISTPRDGRRLPCLRGRSEDVGFGGPADRDVAPRTGSVWSFGRAGRDPAAGRERRGLPRPPPGRCSAEIELSGFRPRCLRKRLPDRATMEREVAARTTRRNATDAIRRRFTTVDARTKLHPFPRRLGTDALSRFTMVVGAYRTAPGYNVRPLDTDAGRIGDTDRSRKDRRGVDG